MSRACTICQHLKRPEIDRRLAAGEPGARLVADYDVSASSLQRHRTNCLGLPSSNRIKKEAARGTAAAALLPSKEILSGSYFELCSRIDQIIEQARNEGSLKIALAGLNSVRQTFDSMARLGGHTSKSADSGRDGASADAAVEVARISQCLLDAFDHEPEIKARIAAALLTLDRDDTTHPAPSGSEPLGHGAAMSDNGASLISQSNSAEQPRVATAVTAPSHDAPPQQQSVQQGEGDHGHVSSSTDRACH